MRALNIRNRILFMTVGLIVLLGVIVVIFVKTALTKALRKGFPSGLNKINAVSHGEEYSIQRLIADNAAILDIAAPAYLRHVTLPEADKSIMHFYKSAY